MKKLAKLALLLPVFLFFITWILLVTVYDGHVEFPHPLAYVGLVAFGSIPLQWAFYITNVFRNKGITTTAQKVIWTWFLLGGSMLMFPFYWYFHIWKDEESQDEAASQPVEIRKKRASILSSKPTTS
jgi:hypothetical protein